jgi:tyrosine decarboxylase/aspartate 1-decarboxylase
LTKKEVLEELSKRLAKDFTYNSGKIMGSMCTKPHPLAVKVYTKYIEKNLGDPGLFPATVEIEKEVIRMIGKIVSNPNAYGHIVSGGAEANILGLWVARNSSKKTKPEVIAPTTAHFSFEKAANLLQFKIVYVNVDENFQVKVEEVEKAISKNTMAIVGVAGSTGLGTVDPIPQLSEIALQKGVYLHVDAAFGGFVIPFLKDLGYKIPDFDFKLPGVMSITIDPHKMGMAPIPAGGIIFRDKSLVKGFGLKIPYLAGGETVSDTLVGTRSGASVCAVWALLKSLNYEGYKKTVQRCMRLTEVLAEGIQRISGVDLVVKPTINVIGIKSEMINVQLIANELRNMGWAISLFNDYIRIVVMPHVTLSSVENFLEDLRKVMGKLSR